MHKARICHRFVSPISNLKVKGESGRVFSLCYDAILSGSKGVAQENFQGPGVCCISLIVVDDEVGVAPARSTAVERKDDILDPQSIHFGNVIVV